MLNEKQIDRMLSKLKRYEDTLDAMIFEKVADLPVSFYQTGESLYEIPDESLFAPMAVGSHWGGEGVYGWFRTGWQVPKELAGRPLFLRPKVGGYEALLWVDGKPFGTFATKIVVTGHGNHYCDMVVKNPKAGQEIAIDLEFYTGHFVRGCFPFEETGRTDYDFVYESMEICVKNEKVANFLFNLRTLNQLAEVLDDRSYRKAELINVLTALHETVYYDPSCISREEFENSLLEGQRIMAPALARRAPLSAPKAGVIGHSHMDTAWLWHVGETIKKCARTYSNQLNLMEQYPEYKFVQSSAYHGEMIRQHYPELFERIRKKVQEGRYEPNGGVWVECDCNITSGESMIRQFLWGQRFTKKYYNYLSDAFWLPDTFGYSAAIPQIMKGCGVKYFLTTKMAWNDTNQFPYDTFWWKGIDGTQVLAHLNKTHVWPEPKAFYEYLYDTKSPDAVRQKYVIGNGIDRRSEVKPERNARRDCRQNIAFVVGIVRRKNALGTSESSVEIANDTVAARYVHVCRGVACRVVQHTAICMRRKSEQLFVIGVKHGVLSTVLVQKIVTLCRHVTVVTAVVVEVIRRNVGKHADGRSKIVGVGKLEAGAFQHDDFLVRHFRHLRRQRHSAVTEQSRGCAELIQNVLD